MTWEWIAKNNGFFTQIICNASSCTFSLKKLPGLVVVFCGLYYLGKKKARHLWPASSEKCTWPLLAAVCRAVHPRQSLATMKLSIPQGITPMSPWVDLKWNPKLFTFTGLFSIQGFNKDGDGTMTDSFWKKLEDGNVWWHQKVVQKLRCLSWY